MIYRSGSNVTYWEDYRKSEPQTLLIADGRYVGNAVTYFAQSTYTFTARVTGLKTLLGTFSLGGVTYAAGNYLFLLENELTLRVYRNPDGADAVLQATLTRLNTEPPFVLTIHKDTVLAYALTSSSETVSVQGLLPGYTYNELVQDSGGTVQFNQLVPLEERTRLVKNHVGGIVDETVGWVLPGDTLFYVPPDYNPQPTGAGHTYSPAGEALQSRLDKLDAAFVQGGLVRVTPMLRDLSNPQSATFLTLGAVSYRLDDGHGELLVRVTVQATSNRARLMFSVDTQSLTLELTDEAHFTGAPFGFAVGTCTANGAGAQGLSLERNELQEVFFTSILAHEPGNKFRDTALAWHEYQIPYVTPGSNGSLIDRRFRIRQSAGPYLYTGRLDRHATLLVLSGNSDVSAREYVGLVVNGRVSQYAVLGQSVFDPRLAVLVKGE